MALGALLFISRWCADFSTMLSLVAWNTQSNTVIQIKNFIGVFSEWKNMMRMQWNFVGMASPTTKPITFINSSTPSAQFTTSVGALSYERLATFPCTGQWTYTWFASTAARAKTAAFIAGTKRYGAISTLAGLWRIARGPATLRTIFRSCFSVRLNLKNRPTFFTRQIDLGIFHLFLIVSRMGG
jgi:hypothetical protein